MTSGNSEKTPWWESQPQGTRLPLAFVKIDRVKSTQDWEGFSDDQVIRRRAQYMAGVQAIAQGFNAAWPLHWQGDGVLLIIADEGNETRDKEKAPASVRAYHAARMLWDRCTVQLNIPVRIAVHAALDVAWDPDTGKLAHQAIDLCGHIESAAPEKSVILTEDVALTLPDCDRREIELIGVTHRDRVPAYVFPSAAAERKKSEAFEPIAENDMRLWEKLRHHTTTSPEICRLKYVGLTLTKKEPPSLDLMRVFVPLNVNKWERQMRPLRGVRPSPMERMEQEKKRHGADTSGEHLAGVAPLVGGGPPPAEEEIPFTGFEMSQATTIPFSDLFAQHRSIVVLGDPGSGKTTLLCWLALIAAGGALTLGRQVGTAERLLPLLVSVSRLADFRSDIGKGASVTEAMARYFHERSVGDTDKLKPFLDARLEAGECLILLDGLDELKTEDRTGVLSWLESFAAVHAENRFVVTSRHVGYTPFGLFDGVEVALRPFDDLQVERYITEFQRAYREWEDKVDDPVVAKSSARELLQALRGVPQLAGLARNPFLLSVLALIHRAEGRLPHHRVQAYQTIARAFCETWEQARQLVKGGEYEKVSFAKTVPILGELALRMHEEYPAGVAPEEFIINTLAQSLKKRVGISDVIKVSGFSQAGINGPKTQATGIPDDEAKQVARAFLKKVGKKLHILIERGVGWWGFFHLTFQEFFVAAGLHAVERFDEEVFGSPDKAVSAHLLNPRWEEIIRLGVGYIAIIQGRPEKARQVVETALAFQVGKPGEEWVNQLGKQIPMAALLAVEAGDAIPPDLQQNIAEKFAQWTFSMPSRLSRRYLEEIGLTEFHKPFVQAYTEALKDEDWNVRGNAAEALRAMKSPEAIPALLEALKDKDEDVRARAMEALWNLSERC